MNRYETHEATVYRFLRRFRNGASMDEIGRIACMSKEQVRETLYRLRQRGYVEKNPAIKEWWQVVDAARELPRPAYSAAVRAERAAA